MNALSFPPSVNECVNNNLSLVNTHLKIIYVIYNLPLVKYQLSFFYTLIVYYVLFPSNISTLFHQYIHFFIIYMLTTFFVMILNKYKYYLNLILSLYKDI